MTRPLLLFLLLLVGCVSERTPEDQGMTVVQNITKYRVRTPSKITMSGNSITVLASSFEDFDTFNEALDAAIKLRKAGDSVESIKEVEFKQIVHPEIEVNP